MNVDGASNVNGNLIACGGILRDHRGTVLGGFLFNIGEGDSYLAKQWGVLMSLRWSWDYGVRSLIIESDCLELVKALQDQSGNDSSVSSITREIQTMQNRAWEVQLSWCPREVNRTADQLAKFALNLGHGITSFTSAPDLIADSVAQDKLHFKA